MRREKKQEERKEISKIQGPACMQEEYKIRSEDSFLPEQKISNDEEENLEQGGKRCMWSRTNVLRNNFLLISKKIRWHICGVEKEYFCVPLREKETFCETFEKMQASLCGGNNDSIDYIPPKACYRI